MNTCNASRYDRANAAVENYNTSTHPDAEPPYNLAFDDERQIALTDLLTDLRHWASQGGCDFDRSVELSLTHFNCELDEERQDDEGGEQA